MKIKHYYNKLFKYEYWPWLVFFIPLIPFHIYYAIKSRYFFYSTAANPAIDKGGLFGESKFKILDQFPEHLIPKMLFVNNETNLDLLKKNIFDSKITFPLILKPDEGGRGFKVRKINTFEDLEIELNASKRNWIIQEFIDLPIEMGVLYHRYPNQTKGKVTSITIKGFMQVVGNGKDSVYNLLLKNERAWFQLEKWKTEKSDLLESIPKHLETIIIEPIGNHCLGTEFISGNQYLSATLDETFDHISNHFKGFYYGRYDLKVKDIENLNLGNVKIMELNGVTSEPGHIYDKSYTILKAYKDIIKEMRIIYEISILNIKSGIIPLSTKEVLKIFKAYFK